MQKAPMIPVKSTLWQSQTDWRQQSWQAQLQGMLTCPDELLQRLHLTAIDRPDLQQILRQFPLRVTEAYLAKMTPGNWQDPLLLQILPQPVEAVEQAGFSDDPLAEADANPVPGIIHKYSGRALLITTPACAVHCRYCFRRNFPYSDNNPSQSQWQQSLDYIRDSADISEVILSGGDPLASGNRYLGNLIDQISDIPHVRTLRIHTRFPVVLPARFDDELLSMLHKARPHIVIVLHSNHANELDDDAVSVLRRLRDIGTTLLNQSVLLRGINDSTDILEALSRRLFDAGVLPYYLHLLDRTHGTGHFEVNEHDARELATALLHRLPGYLVPRLVRENPGAHSKMPISPF